jgi:serine/threonine protein kinase
VDRHFICLQVGFNFLIALQYGFSRLALECHQSAPRAYSCYASAPNDVWSLGVILVNLTCGRNPWKRASFEDTTFRACMKDPLFLRSILPITVELNDILKRIFELDPAQRITIPELRMRIQQCSSFTATPTTTPQVSTPARLPSPPYSPEEYARDAAFNAINKHDLQVTIPTSGPISTRAIVPSPPPSPMHFSGFQYVPSPLSVGSTPNVFSASPAISPASSTSSYIFAPSPQKLTVNAFQHCVPPQPSVPWYAHLAPLAKPFQNTHLPQLRVY